MAAEIASEVLADEEYADAEYRRFLKEKDKYIQLTRDLYKHRRLDENDYKELMNVSKLINNSRDYILKEKDDYER